MVSEWPVGARGEGLPGSAVVQPLVRSLVAVVVKIRLQPFGSLASPTASETNHAGQNGLRSALGMDISII